MASDAKGVIKLALLLVLLTLVLAFCKFVSILARKACIAFSFVWRARFCMAQQFYSYILRPRWYARCVPGPKHHSWTYGHMRMLAQKPPSAMHQQFYKEYGPVVHIHGYLGVSYFGRSSLSR
jgi:hypothetical protein